jgi:hypothetical protein
MRPTAAQLTEVEESLQRLGFHEITPGRLYRQRFGHSAEDLAWTIQADLDARLLTVTRGTVTCDACQAITVFLLEQLGCLPPAATGMDSSLVSYTQPF